MKKHLLIILYLGFISISSFSREYENYGYVYADYCGNTSMGEASKLVDRCKIYLQEKGFNYISSLEKLTRREIYCLWEELREYTLIDGEIYGIIFYDENNDLYKFMYVEMTDSGTSYKSYFVGKYFYEENE